MKLDVGKTYVNKTHKYLLPYVKSYPELEYYLREIPIIGVGIHDEITHQVSGIEGDNIFILFDTTKYPDVYPFKKFLGWVKKQDYFKLDYAFCVDIEYETQHMVVLELPNTTPNVYTNFLQGRYSQMYSTNSLLNFKKNPSNAEVCNVFDRNMEAYLVFKETLKEEFNVVIDYSTCQLLGMEMDLPLKKEEEIFNYTPMGSTYFNIQEDYKWETKTEIQCG